MGASAPHAIDFAVTGAIERSDLPGLCECMTALLSESGAEVVLCDVSGVDPDAVAVDGLARLQLAARRQGCRVRLRNASRELRALVDFMGLTAVLAD